MLGLLTACNQSHNENEAPLSTPDHHSPSNDHDYLSDTSNNHHKHPTSIRDKQGNEYHVISFRHQLWATSNYQQTIFNNGDAIKEAKNQFEWIEFSKQKEAAWCYYLFDSSNKDLYGVYYNAYAVNDPRGLAPEGWTISSQHRLRIINRILQYEAHHLKEKNFWKSLRHIYNSTGFSARPAGLVSTDGEFRGVGDMAYFWTKTEKNPEENICVEITDERNNMYFSPLRKELGMNIRITQKLPHE